MTTSLTLADQNALADGKAPTLPSRVASVLADHYPGEWSSMRSLAELKRDGFDKQIPYLADRMQSACRPCDREKLVQRLTLLGMTMAPNRPQAEATAWIHETARLLADLAEDIVCAAIDSYQLENKFLPTVAEIRERADPNMERRRRAAARLNAMARLIASGANIPALPSPEPPRPREPDKPMTPTDIEEMNRIMANVGATTRYRPDGGRYDVETATERREAPRQLRKPTRQDYIEMGVDPAVLDQMDSIKANEEG